MNLQRVAPVHLPKSGRQLISKLRQKLSLMEKANDSLKAELQALRAQCEHCPHKQPLKEA